MSLDSSTKMLNIVPPVFLIGVIILSKHEELQMTSRHSHSFGQNKENVHQTLPPHLASDSHELIVV